MIFLYVIFGLILLVSLILLIPLNVYVIYNEKIIIKLRILFFSLILNRDKRKTDVKKTSKKKKKSAKKEASLKHDQNKDNKLSPKQLLQVVKETAARIITSTSSYLKVTVNELYIDIASDDAMKTSLLYATVSAAAQAVIDYLDGNTHLKIKKVHVGVDFCKNTPTIRANIKFRMYVWQVAKTLLYTALAYTKAKMSFTQTEENK